MDSVLGLSGLANHTLTVKTGGVTANQLIDVQQSALGDFSGKFGLLVVHSKILAEYKKLGLLNYNKYVITNVLQKEVSLPPSTVWSWSRMTAAPTTAPTTTASCWVRVPFWLPILRSSPRTTPSMTRPSRRHRYPVQ